jgi:hypothetical protein
MFNVNEALITRRLRAFASFCAGKLPLGIMRGRRCAHGFAALPSRPPVKRQPPAYQAGTPTRITFSRRFPLDSTLKQKLPYISSEKMFPQL